MTGDKSPVEGPVFPVQFWQGNKSEFFFIYSSDLFNNNNKRSEVGSVVFHKQSVASVMVFGEKFEPEGDNKDRVGVPERVRVDDVHDRSKVEQFQAHSRAEQEDHS